MYTPGTKLPLGQGLLIGTAVLPVLSDTYQAYKERRSVPGEFVRSTFRNTWPLIVTAGMPGGAAVLPLLYALPVLPQIAAGLHGWTMNRNSYVRQSGTPFSHSFTHSDWTAMAQQRGMASIMGTRSLLGSEATAMSARFARRY